MLCVWLDSGVVGRSIDRLMWSMVWLDFVIILILDSRLRLCWLFDLLEAEFVNFCIGYRMFDSVLMSRGDVMECVILDFGNHSNICDYSEYTHHANSVFKLLAFWSYFPPFCLVFK